MPSRRFARGEHLLQVAPLFTLLEVVVLKPTGVMPYPYEVGLRTVGKTTEFRESPDFLFRPDDPLLIPYRAQMTELTRLEKLPNARNALRKCFARLAVMRRDMIEQNGRNQA